MTNIKIITTDPENFLNYVNLKTPIFISTARQENIILSVS